MSPHHIHDRLKELHLSSKNQWDILCIMAQFIALFLPISEQAEHVAGRSNDEI